MNSVKLFVIILVISAISGTKADDYLFTVDPEANFADAGEICMQKGMVLVKFKTKEEFNDFYAKNYDIVNYQPFWVRIGWEASNDKCMTLYGMGDSRYDLYPSECDTNQGYICAKKPNICQQFAKRQNMK